MSKIKLGELVNEEIGRDAVHIAVIPCKSDEALAPSQPVKVVQPGLVRGCNRSEYVGIVDPFLNDIVQPGQVFLLVLIPNSVQDVSHHWNHPAFDDGSLPIWGNLFDSCDQLEAAVEQEEDELDEEDDYDDEFCCGWDACCPEDYEDEEEEDEEDEPEDIDYCCPEEDDEDACC